MSYVPGSALLHGAPFPVADCYGKPHVGCSYSTAAFADEHKAIARAVKTHRLDDGAGCACCGRPATNAHHWPPIRTTPVFRHRGAMLRPALIAVCGSGTTGCHGGWHGQARFRALWRWDSDEYAKWWWEGDLLDELGPHSPELYLYGAWEFYDMFAGRIWEVRL